MLEKLTINNFAVIDNLVIVPDEGLNIFTGETGAGKSIIISALGFLLGERSGSDILSPNASSATVEGDFKAHNIPPEICENLNICDGIVNIKRIADKKGKTKSFVNGKALTTQKLSQLGEYLVDFHGQNEHQSLLKAETQRSLLDSFGKLDKYSAALREIYFKTERLKEKLNAVSMSEAEKERLLDLYKYQLNDIESASLKQGELEELEAVWPRLKNADKLSLLSADISDSLERAVSFVDTGYDKFKKLADTDAEFSDSLKRLESVSIELSDITEQVKDYCENLNFDPEEVNRCLSRMDKIKKTEQKYGGSYDAVMKFAGELKNKINALEDMSLDREETEKELKKTLEELKVCAEQLSEKRQSAAKILSEAVIKEADGLGFKQVHFSADVLYDADKITQFGGDSVEYLFSANPGYPLRPLRYSASGGEMARVMLAMKNVLARADCIETQVFDEVDAGVGAVTGRLVGKKLFKLAQSKQIFCITHLPQVAAYGATHFFVEKTTVNGVAVAHVGKLNAQQKESEIARMLGGKQKADDISLEHAKKLIKESR